MKRRKLEQFLPYDLIHRAKLLLKEWPFATISAKKLARALECTNREAGMIIRLVGLRSWTDSKNTYATKAYVVHEKLLK